jgi:plastocyanin
MKFDPRRRPRGRAPRFLLVLPFAAASVFLYASGSIAAGPTIEAAGGGNSSYYWNPGHIDTSTGESVAFSNSSPTVPHGITWTGGPGTPACSEVPIDGGKESWSGTCNFTEAGTYTFVCYIHPTEMKGTITVDSAGPTPPTDPNPPEAPGSPGSSGPGGPADSGAIATGLKLAKTQRGGAVRGSIDLPAGGELEVELLGARSSLFDTTQTGKIRVGRLVRSALPPGRAAFTVSLERVARRALRSRGSLPVTAVVSVAAPGGATFERNRRVLMKDQTSSSKGDMG